MGGEIFVATRDSSRLTNGRVEHTGATVRERAVDETGPAEVLPAGADERVDARAGRQARPDGSDRSSAQTLVSRSQILAALSYAIDLTEGQPAGHSLRACMIGMRLAQGLDLDDGARSALYYALLLKDAEIGRAHV